MNILLNKEQKDIAKNLFKIPDYIPYNTDWRLLRTVSESLEYILYIQGYPGGEYCEVPGNVAAQILIKEVRL